MLDKLKLDIQRYSQHETTNMALVRGLFSQGFLAILVYRIFNHLHVQKIPTLLVRVPVERLVEVLTGISIPASCEIGAGLRIHHFGGIILHDSVKLGNNVTLYHQVTLGVRNDSESQAPQLGNNVYVGAGAKIIGNITIGHNAKIGANSVVISDVPENSTAIGVPAKIVKSK